MIIVILNSILLEKIFKSLTVAQMLKTQISQVVIDIIFIII